MYENNEVHNQYRYTAYLYDLDPRPVVKDDIPFYLERAAHANGEILEIACGTGRVTLPLARAGFPVTGIDLSGEMLAELSRKLQYERQEVQERVNTVEANMASFELGREFAQIIIPFRAFQLLTEEDQQLACLACIRKHLTDDGQLILDVYKPYGILDESWVQPETEDWTLELPNGRTVRRTSVRKTIDVERQINYPQLNYYVTESDGRTEKQVEPLAMKYYYEDQLRDLLQRGGFSVTESYGYYDGRPTDHGPELIFVCKKH
ncbi:class I SAM-dependent methyltransferase [Paenibacillus turpanensis]|uniref:class I SAM-dependent methyltransferase n=1 Tax=Paenibacillus turpanensis TaxID=2689078 RepID=UPI00140BF973|nr:class I SAM-dependent methyltransferase [Paenibacillus turpanensis]